jgi:hypothetical protein
MSKKAPDTRNRLDNNKGLNKSHKPKKKGSLKELQNNKTKFKLEKKPSKGELFIKAYGFSKSTKRAMQKNGLPVTSESIAELRVIRKARKKKQLKIKQDKHKTALAKRGAGKSKSSTPGKKKK